MAPVPETDDFYAVLRVDFYATLAQIQKAYKKLALELHPDRNKAANATEAFQQLAKAHETLSDDVKRRNYDATYPRIKRGNSTAQSTASTRPHPTRTQQEDVSNDAAQIIALEKSKRDRAQRWRIQKAAIEATESLLRGQLRKVMQEIHHLEDIAATEPKIEANKDDSGGWMLGTLVPMSEEEKERMERARQERRIEKDMKERRMANIEARIEKEQEKLEKGNKEVEAADLVDDIKIKIIRTRIFAREKQERMKKDAEADMKNMEQFWKKVQEQWARDLRGENGPKRAERAEAEAWEQFEEAFRDFGFGTASRPGQSTSQQNSKHKPGCTSDRKPTNTGNSDRSTCHHGGWWDKVHKRAACPECEDVWTYLLQCPGCSMKACPKCQADVRPRGRAARRRARTPSPDFGSAYYYAYDSDSDYGFWA